MAGTGTTPRPRAGAGERTELEPRVDDARRREGRDDHEEQRPRLAPHRGGEAILSPGPSILCVENH